MNERLQALIADMLDIPLESVPDMVRSETEQWDSLNHLRLISAFEQEFGVRLTLPQIAGIQSPRELQQLLDASGPGG